MELKRGYRYKIYPTIEQTILLSNHCFNANQAFNIMVSLNRSQFKHNKDKIPLDKKLSVYSQELLSQQRMYLSSTNEDDIVKTILKNRKLDINTKVLQQTRMLFNQDLQKKLKNIQTLKEEHYKKEKEKQLKFNLINKNNNNEYKIKKFELFNYKKSGILGYNSFQTTKEQFSLLNYVDKQCKILPKWKILRLFGEEFKIKWTRNLISDIKTITITKEPNGEWYISFSQIIPLIFKTIQYHKDEQILGMDINIDNVVFSDGKKFSHTIKNKNTLKNNETLLKLEQKRSRKIELAKKEKIKLKNVSGYIKTSLLINKIHKKNTNIKDWHLHHFINELVTYMQEKQITKLKMEKLNVKAMTSKEQDNINVKKDKIIKYNSKTMRKNILQVSFFKLQQILNYKCVLSGIVVEYVEAKNTSKRCHCCGEINNTLTLKDRQWQCSSCHSVHDRDVNASLNIKKAKSE